MPHKQPIHPFDQLHHTDTSGLIPGATIAQGTNTRVEHLTAYYGVAPSILHRLLDHWLQHTHPLAPIAQTVFLDVGAGKGRALLLASQYPFLRVEGVELNADLAAIAQSNIALWHQDPTAEPLAPIALHHADATLHPIPPEPTLAFLFHPFELPLLRRFLRHIERSRQQNGNGRQQNGNGRQQNGNGRQQNGNSRAHNPAPLDLLYANAEHDSLLDHHPAFTRLWMGRVPMTPEDHLADLAAIAQQKEYGSTGDELCAVYRYTPRGHVPQKPPAKIKS